jgi:transposase
VASAHRSSVDAFHLVKLGNDMLTEVRQRLTQQVHGRRGRSIDSVWANRRLLLRAGDTLSDRARDRLTTVFTTDDATGKLQAAWQVKEQLRTLQATGFLAGAATAKAQLQVLAERAAQPDTNRLWRTICRWWKEIEVLFVTGATTEKVEANNTAIKHIKRTGRGFTNGQLQNAYPVAQCRQNSGMNTHHGRTFTTNREEPGMWWRRAGRRPPQRHYTQGNRQDHHRSRRAQSGPTRFP